MNIRDIKIGTQLRIGYGIILVLLIGMGLLSWFFSDQIARQSKTMYDHPMQVRYAIGSLKSGVLSISHQVKDLFLYPSAEETVLVFREVERYRADVWLYMETLYRWYLGPRADIDRIRDEFIVYNNELSITFDLIREGSMDSAVQRTKSESGITGQQVDKILEAIAVVDDFSRNKADHLFGVIVKKHGQITAILGVIIAFTIVISILIIYWLVSRINQPIRELSSAMQAFRSGDISVRNQYRSRNELGLLSSGFNDMADTIAMELTRNKYHSEISSSMLSEEEAHAFSRLLLIAMVERTEAQIGSVYMLNDQQDAFELWECIGLDPARCHSFATGTLGGEFGMALSTKRMQRLTDIPADTRFVFSTVSGDYIPRELITIPVVSGDAVVAVITIGTLKRFSDISIGLLEQLLPTINARMNGILLFRKNILFTSQLGEQNRELEEQKRELSSLSDELKEQNRELSMQKSQLDEANRLKNSFLANMSHELRTPLNSVIALSGVLSRRLSGTIAPEEFGYLGVIERNGRHLLSLINDLLDLSRIEAGREEIDISEFNVTGLIADIIETISPIAQEKGLALTFHQDDHLPDIHSDYRKCLHILQNIIGNAVKFTSEGSVDIHVEKRYNMICVKVRDTGIGIGNHELESIFDEFHQADSGNARKFGGTGLGLSIARKYALLLGGRIEVESTPHQGSLFTICLPVRISPGTSVSPASVAGVEREPVPKKQHTWVRDPARHTILLVDDSEPAIIQLKDLFTSQGYQVMIAGNGAEAIALSQGLIPDAIILDLMMPEMDGFTVLKHLRDHEATVDIPVIILTAKYITKEELAILKANNIKQLIQKGDINKEHLLESVALVLSSGKQMEKKPEIPRIPVPVTGTPRVLIVEDNPDNMLTFKALMEDHMQVFEAWNGREAVSLALEHLPHLILMDIALPEMNGIEALHAIRREKKTGHIPVLAVTASAMLGDRDSILAEGFDGYISKPIDHHHFKETIARFIK